MKSGITGWAQVHGLRGKTSLSDRIEWDNYYIENWSLWLDVKILLMTVLAKKSDTKSIKRAMNQIGTMTFLGTLLLIEVTPFRTLLIAMRRLRVPGTLVATLQFMYRYLFVLTEELDRMVTARRSRTFRRSGRLDWGLLSGLIGTLFLRAFERGERVHAAMLARGWDGTVRTLE